MFLGSLKLGGIIVYLIFLQFLLKSHMFKEGSKVAYAISKYAVNSSPKVWWFSVLDFCSALLSEDIVGTKLFSFFVNVFFVCFLWLGFWYSFYGGFLQVGFNEAKVFCFGFVLAIFFELMYLFLSFFNKISLVGVLDWGGPNLVGISLTFFPL